MKVITLNQKAFDLACLRLAGAIKKDCTPSAIVGVVTGGAVVARLVHKSLLTDMPDIKYYEVSASRSSSIVKKKTNIKYLFQILPLFILNYLRILEHMVLRFNMKNNVNHERNVQLNDELHFYLQDAKQGCVFIIDDAIDSGATIEGVVTVLKKLNSNIEFKVAALVVTQKFSSVLPDIFLYKNVLIRFPWSTDYKSDE